jgi:predicted esterase
MTKRFLIFLLLLSSISELKAQSYKKLADSALRLMWSAKDTVGYRNSLNLYEEAFKLYPKEINTTGLYKASVIASELKANNKAFYYIEMLLAMNNEENTTWSSLTFVYPQREYENLFNDKRWPAILAKAQNMKVIFFKNLKDRQGEFERGFLKSIDLTKAKDGKQAYDMIKSFNNFLPKKDVNYSIKFKVTDSLNTSYFVRLPDNYDPKKSYPVLFFLHGAVQGNSLVEYQSPSWVLDGWNRFYTKYAAIYNVIMVYPKGSKKYNWMGPDDGFFMIPTMLKQIKRSINIDDDKVFITGHSNGATGSFSYLMKQQSPFAGFYGFNTQPKVRTGGTFIKNILNRSYFNVSTNEDYYFPPDANDSLNVIMTGLKVDYQDHRYLGWPHWFPQFDESEPLYPMIFRDIAGRKRNPFQSSIYWESDDVKYGKADWIKINQLDTLTKSANWHQTVNFNIYKLLSYNKKDSLITKDTLVKAFNFPRKSGVVKGYYKNNEFHLEASAVKSISVLISPDMIDMSKPIIVFVNGVQKVTHKAAYNKDFIIANFVETYDRKAIWVDKIDLTL